MVLKNLWRRPGRTALTALGLAVTVGSMVALLAIRSNAEESATRAFNRRGWDLVVTQAGKTNELASDFGEDIVEQARNLPGVDRGAGTAESVLEILPLLRESGTVWEPAIMIHGLRPDHPALSDTELVGGRTLRAGDAGKVMLGKKLADDLGKGPGDTVILGAGDRFEVVGVLNSPIVFENRRITMLLEDARRLTGKRLTGFTVRAATTARRATPEADAEIARLKEAIEALHDPNDPSLRLKANSPDEFVNSLSQLRLVRALTWMYGVIAVAIGVLVMLNTMFMSVLERTQEIGILRAVGWPAIRVIWMVLAEALMLATVAAGIGTVVAAVGLRLLVMAPEVSGFVEPRIPPRVVAAGFALTLLVGLLGGLLPAVRASRLPPTEAIRHD
jgi:putative ABC transport system permease protein